MTNSVVIIGANRGIGLGFVKHYLKHEWAIHATKRNSSKSTELDALSNKIQIYSSIETLNKASFDVIQNIKKDHNLIVKAKIKLVTVNKVGKPIKVPSILEKSLINI